MSGFDRRGVLLGAGALGAGAVIAACSSSTKTEPTASEATTSEASAGAESTSTKPAGTQIDASTVPVGGGRVLEDVKIVVTQPTAGQFHAFSAVYAQGLHRQQGRRWTHRMPLSRKHFQRF